MLHAAEHVDLALLTQRHLGPASQKLNRGEAETIIYRSTELPGPNFDLGPLVQ